MTNRANLRERARSAPHGTAMRWVNGCRCIRCDSHLHQAAADLRAQWDGDDFAGAVVRTMRAMRLWVALTPGAAGGDAIAGASPIRPLTGMELIAVMVAGEELRDGQP